MHGTKVKRDNSIQALRGLGCLGVFLNHCQFPNIAYWTLTMFFMLSGMLLTRTELTKPEEMRCSRANPFAYTHKRIRKLYPLHIVFTLFVLVLHLYWGRHDFNSIDFSLMARQTLANILLIQSWIPNPVYYWSMNDVSWYLSTAVFLYFSFPFLLRLIGKYKSKTAAHACIVGLLFIQYFLAYHHEEINRFFVSLFRMPENTILLNWIYNISPFYRLIDFFIGCNLGYILSQPQKDISSLKVHSIDILCVALFWLAIYAYRGGSATLSVLSFQRGPLFTPFCIFFISSFALHKGFISRLFTNRVSVFMGNISAEFYLVHFPVITCVSRICARFAMSFEISLILVTMISAVLSISFSLIWRNYFSKRKATA